MRWKIAGGLCAALWTFAGGAGGASGDAGAAAAGNWFVPDAELGYALDPARPEINARGFRGPEVDAPKPPGAARVLVLGDSVAWDENSFVDRLLPELAALAGGEIELLNASVPGYTAWQERRYFERDLAELAPDLLLWQHCLNDHHRVLHQLDARGERLLTPEARRALDPPGGGPLGALLSWSWLATEWRRRSFARELESRGAPPWEWREDLCTAWREPSWVDWEAELAALRRALLAASPAAKLAVVSVPAGAQLEPRWSAAEAARQPQAWLREACARQATPLLDLLPVLESTGARSEELFRDGIHLTPRGHELAAEAIARFAERERLLALGG